ncbi:MAG: hypothetical protein ACFB0B_03965 [Thermonemataceae bacterium]
MDSSWVAENALRLFETYQLPDIEPTQAQKAFCLSCFQDQSKLMIASLSLIGHPNTFDYPFIEMQFITSNDTLSLYTRNPTPLSLPWVTEGTNYSYNPKISILLADLLPDLRYSNSNRLAGDYSAVPSYSYQSVEEVFTKVIIYRYCTVFNGKKRKRRKRIYVDKETTITDR